MAKQGAFTDKVVWITGASSGIGRAIAAEFARRGARTVLTARREEALRETQNLCGGEKRSVVVAGDLGELDGLEALHATAREAFGRLDIAVLNAGLSQRGPAIETDPQVIHRVNALNFLSPAMLVRPLAARMLEDGGGRIVAVSSLSTRVPTPLRSAYAASKAALETYLTVVRRELYGTGVTVTLALPGFVRTDISRNALNADGSTHGVLDTAQQQGMAPELCARRIVDGIARGKREILLPSDVRTRVGLFLSRWAPGVLDRLISNARVT
ncbi:MAG: SDR family NAD(P)-dependent oxidoreductase [Spirochaetota bacterium]